MQTKAVPNEILVRYDDSGAFQGAYTGTLTLVIADDGVTVISRTASGLTPYASPADPAFVAVLGQALSDALAANTALQAQVTALQAKVGAAP